MFYLNVVGARIGKNTIRADRGRPPCVIKIYWMKWNEHMHLIHEFGKDAGNQLASQVIRRGPWESPDPLVWFVNLQFPTFRNLLFDQHFHCICYFVLAASSDKLVHVFIHWPLCVCCQETEYTSRGSESVVTKLGIYRTGSVWKRGFYFRLPIIVNGVYSGIRNDVLMIC